MAGSLLEKTSFTLRSVCLWRADVDEFNSFTRRPRNVRSAVV